MPPDKKASGGGGGQNAFGQLLPLFVGLFILSAIIAGLLNYIESFGLGPPESIWDRIADYFLERIWPIWKIVAALSSVILLFGIIRNSWKLRAINIEEEKIYNPRPETNVENEGKIMTPINEKWQKVINYLNSSNPSDWRLAIIESDVMLEEVLRASGYAGESIGDMLKTASKNDFLTLDDAWEAHKVRNAIAHSSANFQLTEREAKRVIALFERVFKEFQVI